MKTYKADVDLDRGVIYIKRTRNNTHVACTDRAGNTKVYISGGCLGYSGSKEGSTFVGELVVQETVKRAMAQGYKRVDVRIKGLGAGKS